MRWLAECGAALSTELARLHERMEALEKQLSANAGQVQPNEEQA